MTRTATNPTLEWRGVEPSREVSLKRVVLLPFVTLRFDLRGFFFFFFRTIPLYKQISQACDKSGGRASWQAWVEEGRRPSLVHARPATVLSCYDAGFDRPPLPPTLTEHVLY